MHVLRRAAVDPGNQTGDRLTRPQAGTETRHAGGEPAQAGNAEPASAGVGRLRPWRLARNGPRAGRPEQLAIGAALVLGLAVRIWILRHPLGALDSDEAVIGLMADRLRSSHQMTTFFWGQNYGAPIEAIIAAGLFSVVRASVVALKVVPIALSAVAALLTWRIGRLLASPAAGRWAGTLLWAWPPAFVYWSTKTAVYWGSLCLSLAAVLLASRLARQDGGARAAGARLAEFAGLGLAVGLSWWANPQTLYLLAPAAVWFAVPLIRRWAYLPAAAAGAAVGAAPWLRYGLIHHWASLATIQRQPAGTPAYAGRLLGFFKTALPEALSLRQPYTGRWELGRAGPVLYVTVLAGFALWLALALLRSLRPGATRGPLLVALVALTYPFLFAASPMSWYVAFPRYLLFLAPAVALLLGLAAARSWVWLPLLALAGVLTVTGIASLNASGQAQPYGPDVHVPVDLAPLQSLLTRYHVRDAFADYWLAYRTTFQTGETTLVDPTYVVRDPLIDGQVRASPDPAYLFITASATLTAFERDAQQLGVPLALHAEGPFTLALPQRKVLPGQLAGLTP
ncbi:MAG TPA: hypothetical protein VHA57_10210 [Actinomycetota bacterium]|nr:hypothetical protein [Actinomycetota bacterium]